MSVRMNASSRIQWTSMPDYSSTNYTIAGWVRRESGAGGSGQYLFTTGNFVGVLCNIGDTTNETPGFTVDLATSDKSNTFSSGISASWKHYAFVNSDYTATTGASCKIFRDGKLVSGAGTGGSGATVAWNSTWVVGNRTDNARQLAGDIAGLGIWTRELSQDELQLLAYGMPPEQIPGSLAFCPSLTPERPLFDPVTSQQGVIGAGTFSFTEEPPLLASWRDLSFRPRLPPGFAVAAGATYTPRLSLLGVG